MQSLRQEQNPLMVSLSNHVPLCSGSSFDKLRMSGLLPTLILSLSKDDRKEELLNTVRWFDRLTMSGFRDWHRPGRPPGLIDTK